MNGTTSVGAVSEPVRKELFDPEQAVAEARREFGEHGGVSPSIERSSTFTVMEPGAMPEIFSGKRGPDRGGCYLYSRHFNPTVDVLDRYSMTKFINGASDLIGGCICCSREFGHALYDLHTGRVMLLGPTLDPRVAFDVIQRLPHLGIRMREHSRRALAIAQHLESLGLKVIYPGLPSHPGHERIKAMANAGYGFGGMLAVDCQTSARAEQLLSVLQNKERFGLIAVSLGYFDTLMSCSSSSTSSEIPPDEQDRIGLSPGLLRLAIGYTGSLESRLTQIEHAVREVSLV
ncbi:MAG: PLP-dependent transferase [Verrucomicrobia bacterium]|nr:PLP-dependent transferase [Verrucomicrobiota bacterium]